MGEISAVHATRRARTVRRRWAPSKRYLVAGWSRREWLRTITLLSATMLFIAVGIAAVMRFTEPAIEMALVPPVVAIFVVALFLLPVQTLPATALVALALMPMRLIPNDGPFNAMPPLAILMGVWVFRRVILGHRPTGAATEPVAANTFGPRFGVYATAILFIAWLGVSLSITVADETSIGWTMSFVASVLLPLLVFDARAEAGLLTKVFLVMGALVGTYVVFEMLLGVSPLYGTVEALVGPGTSEELDFSVYRARAGFAHPLFAAAFLSIPAALGVGVWLISGRKGPLVCAAISGAGLVATVSRGSIVAIAVAVAFGILLAPVFIGWRNVARWLLLVVLTVIGGIAVLNFGPLVERSSSMESQISADVRERAVGIAVEASVRTGWLGTGPGTSGETGRLFDTIVIENSMLQLLISIGAPGLSLFLLLMAALLWSAWRNRNLAVILAAIAYVVSISSFNSLDAVRGMHVVLGFLLIMALNSPAPQPAFGIGQAARDQQAPDRQAPDRPTLALAR